MKNTYYMMQFVILILLHFSIISSTPKPFFVNWSGNQHCTPYEIKYPSTLKELISTIVNAANGGYSIRAFGSGHSFNDIVNTDGYLISLRLLNRILLVDQSTQQVSVEAGITLHELNEQLAQLNLALPNQAVIDEMSLGGAISTMTHGGGKTGSLSSFVTEIHLVTADGILHKFSEYSDTEAFTAARGSLGMLGIIYCVRMQCVPAFSLTHHKKTITVAELCKDYKKLLCDNDYFHFTWDVPNNSIIVDVFNLQSSTKEGENNGFNENMGTLPSHKALCWYHIDNNDKGPVSEIAIPCNLLPEALALLKQVFKDYSQKGVQVAEVIGRFSKAENILLSPSFDGDVVYLGGISPVGDQSEECYKDIEKALFSLKGRPHWGKINFLDYEKVYSLYGENFIKFMNVKKRLDPTDVFSNAWTKRTFYKTQ